MTLGPTKQRKPRWLTVRLPGQGEFEYVRRILDRYRLTTVCESARCPNRGECWSKKAATIMIMGAVCTRHCRFCAVTSGNPGRHLERDEADRVAQAVKDLGLQYVVVTSVDRDDLPDRGARHYAGTIAAIKAACPQTRVEALIPDFDGRPDLVNIITEARPYVVGHNLETVERLTSGVRDRRAGYRKSLEVLRIAKNLDGSLLTKSGIMVGLGENENEVLATMRDAREAGCDIFTIGQYLQPTRRHLPVVDYVVPDKFDYYKGEALQLGFRSVAAGPLVRSSYHAWEASEIVG